jgi:site-specific recombinase XerD
MRVRGYSPKTLTSYAAGVCSFAVYLAKSGVNDLREVTSTTVRNYQLQLQGHEYSPWTVMLRLQTLRRFFDHLESSQHILVNPCSGIRCCKLPIRVPKTVLTLEEAQRLLATPDVRKPLGVRDRAILEVFYSSGLRLEEISRLAVMPFGNSRLGYRIL